MTGFDHSQLIQDVIAGIILIGGVVVYSRARVPQQVIKNLQQLTDTYEKRIKALEDELKNNHLIQLQNVAAISDLQGQVKVYKELPLQELADGILKVSITNTEILETLKQSALVLVKDTRKAEEAVAGVAKTLEAKDNGGASD